MKILLINQTHARSGGANVVYLNTGRIFEEKGHNVIYFAQHSPNNEKTTWKRFFYNGPKNNFEKVMFCFYNWRSKRKLQELLKEERPDIAHIHELGYISGSIMSVLKRNRIPVVLTVHDYHFVCPVSHFLNSKGISCELCKDRCYFRCTKEACCHGNFFKSFVITLLFYYRRLFYSPFKYLNGIIFVSHFSQDKNIEHDQRFKLLNHIVIYNSTKASSVLKTTIRGKYFLYFGRLSYEKGVDVLVKAFTKLTEYHLIVVGTGDLDVKLKEIAKGCSNISFTGYKKEGELAVLIKDALFVVVPSVCYENNPMAVVEAYSFNKPVIGAQSGAITEFVKDGETGYLFPKGNIDTLISCIKKASSISEMDYLRMSRNAGEFFHRNFEDEMYYSKLIRFYHSILNERKSRELTTNAGRQNQAEVNVESN